MDTVKRNFPPLANVNWGLIGAIILCVITWGLVLRWILG